MGPTRSVLALVELARLLAGADFEIAAHAGGQIDDDVLVLGANALHHLAIEMDAARALAGLGIADMAMNHGGAGGGRFERGIGDLLRRHRNGRMLADSVAGAGHRAGNDDLWIHLGRSLEMAQDLARPY